MKKEKNVTCATLKKLRKHYEKKKLLLIDIERLLEEKEQKRNCY
jgi:hypothetical protein